MKTELVRALDDVHRRVKGHGLFLAKGVLPDSQGGGQGETAPLGESGPPDTSLPSRVGTLSASIDDLHRLAASMTADQLSAAAEIFDFRVYAVLSTLSAIPLDDASPKRKAYGSVDELRREAAMKAAGSAMQARHTQHNQHRGLRATRGKEARSSSGAMAGNIIERANALRASKVGA